MTIAAILTASTLAYFVGYYRGHVAALAVPYAMLAARMEELTGQPEQLHNEINE